MGRPNGTLATLSAGSSPIAADLVNRANAPGNGFAFLMAGVATDYTEIILSSKKYLSSESLRYWTETLNPLQFVRIHKSYIVNTDKIEKMMGNQLYLLGGIVVPIGRAYKEGFVKRFIR